VLVHHYKKKRAHFRLAHLKNRDVLTRTASPTRYRFQKKNSAHAQNSFEFSIPLPILSKFSEKSMSHSPIPIPSGFSTHLLFCFCFCSTGGIVVKKKKFSSAYHLVNIQIFCTGSGISISIVHIWVTCVVDDGFKIFLW